MLLQLLIPGMKCGGCLGAVTRAIRKLDPDARIEGSLETRNLKVMTDKPEASLLDALREAGYSAQVLSETAE